MSDRRQFLLQSLASAGLLAVGARELFASPLGMPIGCQTWPVRHLIAQSFPRTLATLRRAGFQAIELCSPVGYAQQGFAGLARYRPAQLRRMIADAGLICISSHFTFAELRARQPERIAWAKELGLRQMLVPSLDGPTPPTLDQVKRLADEYNRIGENAARAGLRQGLHNEVFEDGWINGQAHGRRVYDALFEYLDPRWVKFQFQVIAIREGLNPITYFRRYPGRFLSMHLQGWSARARRMAPIGQDSLNWPRIFAAAKIGGIQNYFLEMSLPLMEASLPYLRRLS